MNFKIINTTQVDYGICIFIRTSYIPVVTVVQLSDRPPAKVPELQKDDAATPGAQ